MKYLSQVFLIVLIIGSCKTNSIIINQPTFDKNMEEEWNNYIKSTNEIIDRTGVENHNLLLSLKNKITKLYMESKDEYDDFPELLTIKISRIISKIDKKISMKIIQTNRIDKKIIINPINSRYRVITINPTKIDEKIKINLEDDNFRDDTLSFIGELDNGETVSFSQKDLKSKFIWPLNSIYITSPYGFRNDPFLKNKVKFHHGLDLAAKFGTPVKASNNGKVIFASKNGGYGLTVMILHHNNILSLYAHLSKIIVLKGEFVTKGDIVGEVGSTGKSTGPHLHFEIRKNKKSMNPLFFIKNKK